MTPDDYPIVAVSTMSPPGGYELAAVRWLWPVEFSGATFYRLSSTPQLPPDTPNHGRVIGPVIRH